MFIPQYSIVNGHEGILLEWDRSVVLDFSHYELQWSNSSGGPYEKLAETTTNKYIVPAVEPGQVYYFVIYAWDVNGNRSEVSKEVEVVIL
jgi:fibronectin type 3 domain-containing protein